METKTTAIDRLRSRIAALDTDTLLDTVAHAFATRDREESRILYAVAANHLVQRLGLEAREVLASPDPVAAMSAAA